MFWQCSFSHNTIITKSWLSWSAFIKLCEGVHSVRGGQFFFCGLRGDQNFFPLAKTGDPPPCRWKSLMHVMWNLIPVSNFCLKLGKKAQSITLTLRNHFICFCSMIDIILDYFWGEIPCAEIRCNQCYKGGLMKLHSYSTLQNLCFLCQKLRGTILAPVGYHFQSVFLQIWSLI